MKVNALLRCTVWRWFCWGSVSIGVVVLSAFTAQTEQQAGSQQSLASPHRVSVKGLNLSRVLSADELTATGHLGEALFPAHEPKDKKSADATHFGFGKANASEPVGISEYSTISPILSPLPDVELAAHPLFLKT